MEHSLLHGLGLWGLVVVAGGPLLVLGLLGPARRALGGDAEMLAGGLERNVAKWVLRGALLMALVTFLGLFVQAAEARGGTAFGGVSLAETTRFALHTRTGQLSLARILVLLGMMPLAARRPSRAGWCWLAALAFTAIVLACLVSHAGAQPADRFRAMAVQVAHVSAVTLWMGVLLQLLAARKWLLRARPGAELSLVACMVRRFSPVALAAVSLLVLTGILAACRFLGRPTALVTSAYGLTLLVKLAVAIPALAAGWINYRSVRPALLASVNSRSPEGGKALQRFGRTLELETTAGLLVIMVAGILGSVQPPGENGSLVLTPPQVRALETPRLPSPILVDPASYYGLPERTLNDLLYSEFTHHWSGVMVTLLGFCWLTQGAVFGNRASRWATRAWPLLLVPFAAFVVFLSDPEIWWLRRVSLAEVLGNAQLLEHQSGGLLVLALAGLGWRARNRAGPTAPLGPLLPVLMALGSLMLLGHAHSTPTTDDALTNLINVQHAIFGAFGLLASVVQWLGWRGLMPLRHARFWPVFVIALGLFMTFCYRETIGI